MDGWMDGWMVGDIDGWIDGSMDRWIDGSILLFNLVGPTAQLVKSQNVVWVQS